MQYLVAGSIGPAALLVAAEKLPRNNKRNKFKSSMPLLHQTIQQEEAHCFSELARFP